MKISRIASGLAGILLLSLGLRLWGISFGLPYPFHVDENWYVAAALNLGAGLIGRQANPTGFSHILFGEYAAYFVIGRVIGLFKSLADFEQAYRADPGVFFLLGRLTSALLGVVTVATTFCLGKRLRDNITGLGAALFVGVAFLHVRDSHYAVPDIAAAAFVSLTVLLCVVSTEKQSLRALLLAGAVGGFAVATKWSAWQVVLPIGLSTWVVLRRYGAALWPVRSWLRLLGVAVSFVFGFALGGGELFLKPRFYWSQALIELRSGDAGGFWLWQVDSVPGWLFYIKTLWYGLGPVLLLLGIAASLWWMGNSVRRKKLNDFIVLLFPAFYFALMGATRHYFARYALPLIPFIALFAASGLVEFARLLATRHQVLARSAAVLLCLAAVIPPLASDLRYNALMTRPDTRLLAKAWVEQTVPSGAKIAVDWLVYGPPLSTPERPTPNSAAIYYVTEVKVGGLSDHGLDWYRDQGFDYLIASSFMENLTLISAERTAQRQAFHDSLDQDAVLLAEFKPTSGSDDAPFVFDEMYGPAISLWQRERPGPTIWVYKIR